MITPSQSFKYLRLFCGLMIVTTLACADGPDTRGREYKNLNELSFAQNKIGFVKIGQFGNSWPARIIEVTTTSDAITFRSPDGSQHIYDKFEGYQLKMIRLLSLTNNQQDVVVYRSEGNKAEHEYDFLKQQQ